MERSTAKLIVQICLEPPPTIRLCGEADFHNKHKISDAFDELLLHGQKDVRADLSELVYMDSSALSALVVCAAQASEAGGAVELVGVSAQASKVLTLCGAAAFFRSSLPQVPVCDESALRSPSQGFWRVSDFALPASPEAAGIARNRLTDVLRSLPLGASDSHDVLVAAGEAIANAIKHGCAGDGRTRISVKCVAGPSRLAIDVADPGPGFDPSAVPRPSGHHVAEGGMGIYMMRELMDEVSFSFDGFTNVRLVKYIRPPSAEVLDSGELLGV